MFIYHEDTMTIGAYTGEIPWNTMKIWCFKIEHGDCFSSYNVLQNYKTFWISPHFQHKGSFFVPVDMSPQRIQRFGGKNHEPHCFLWKPWFPNSEAFGSHELAYAYQNKKCMSKSKSVTSSVNHRVNLIMWNSPRVINLSIWHTWTRHFCLHWICIGYGSVDSSACPSCPVRSGSICSTDWDHTRHPRSCSHPSVQLRIQSKPCCFFSVYPTIS